MPIPEGLGGSGRWNLLSLTPQMKERMAVLYAFVATPNLRVVAVL